MALLGGAFAGCAGPNSERVLSPLFSSHSAAGGIPEIEALGGAYLSRRNPSTGQRDYWAIRPLLSNRFDEKGDRFTWFLPPLGFIDEDSERGTRVAQFVPLARYATLREESGFKTWSLLVIPGLYWSAHEDGRVQRAFFPFFGVVEKFLSLDRGTFALFPLWLRVERYGRTTDHFLFPIFSYSRGAGGKAFRIWPFFGLNRWEGRYSRWFFAWPFFHWQRNGLQYAEDQHQTSWFLWPLIGRAVRGPASQTTVLWPFFGYTTDPETGFWAWDGPFPLVRFQGGDPDRPVRKRVWPFFSYYKGDGLTSRWFAWPLINRRHEEYADGTKEATNVFPVWRSSTRTRDRDALPREGEEFGRPAGTERFRKVWPLGKVRTIHGPEAGSPGEKGGERLERDLTVIDLNPFQELRFMDENYAWLWELYTRKERGDELRSRSWLGLWRHEKDRDEDRRSLSALWSARDYDRAGRRAHERSWLFGLLRYRSIDGGGFTFLRPAFPGPGWPIARTPSSTPGR
ncbi:hypothetical protein Poly30_33310 [Planctomycetes bacterium Poly30]|uniref:Uncharacterized protein n=1 Tax=Saltatorellus ferox TaxID=2528018 RepID=A0A518EUS2_9BACT|nr:hypothetical protein Poly30_33310 [Planctomycetes bacterium Poly30]